jgi:protein SCO1/2
MKQRRIGLRAASLVLLSVAALGVGAGFAIHVLGSGRGSSSPSNPPGLHGQATWQPMSKPAPGFSLPDQSGHPVSLASLRGTNVMLAFLSSRCRLACAREARFLGTALRMLPPSARPVLVVVSVDPLHDTSASTRAATARWGLAAAANWHWLLGSRDQLGPVWRSYRVEPGRSDAPGSAGTPVYLIDRGGFERAGLLYPFPPTWPAGDLRILAREE